MFVRSQHLLGVDGDIAWKQKLSDYARDTFGLFGSECGREWALADSRKVGVFHGFGPTTLAWRGRTWTVAREQTIAPCQSGAENRP